MPLVKSSTPVLDAGGAPAVGRRVRVYRADTGDFLGETTTAAGTDTGTTVAHLPLNFVRGSNAMIDAAGGTWAFEGSGVAPSFDTHRFGGSSLRATGVASSRVRLTGAAAWAFGTADFNVQFFCRVSALPTSTFYSAIGNWAGSVGFCFFLRPAGVVDFRINASTLVSASGVFAANTDYCVDIRRVSGNCSVRLNGTQVISGALSNNLTRSDFVHVAANGVSTDSWVGWVSHVRAVAGGVLGDSAPTAAPARPGLAAGHYEFWTPYSGEVFVVFMDDEAGAIFNHIVHRTVPV